MANGDRGQAEAQLLQALTQAAGGGGGGAGGEVAGGGESIDAGFQQSPGGGGGQPPLVEEIENGIFAVNDPEVLQMMDEMVEAFPPIQDRAELLSDMLGRGKQTVDLIKQTQERENSQLRPDARPPQGGSREALSQIQSSVAEQPSAIGLQQ